MTRAGFHRGVQRPNNRPTENVVMTVASTTSYSVALIGNPNTGKSTLFNALCGVRQRVGNYPGVTVEKKLGRMEHAGRWYEVIDLPGTYSLAPRSLDEMVAVDVLLGRQSDVCRPDAVILIVDASNLERNLYLVSQVLELGLPTVLALNMMDVAHSRGLTVDVPRLARQLGIPVVPLEAHRRRGLEDLRTALDGTMGRPAHPPASPFPESFQQEVAGLGALLAGADGEHGRSDSQRGGVRPKLPTYLIERLLLDTGGYLEGFVGASDEGQLKAALGTARERLRAAGFPVPAVEAIARYGWVGQVLEGVLTRPAVRPVTTSDRIDRVLTHKFWGTAIFALLMLLVFQAVFSWSVPAMDWIDQGFGVLGELVARVVPSGALQSLLVDGVLGGFGGVVVFLPQIFLLFFFIAVLEDCGYMARAAYLMDKLMVRLGLSGKSFIPLLSSFACAIPGIMATRVIENRRDRLTTILIAPLMSCSARLPVYTLLILAFIPARRYAGGWLSLQGVVMFGMYAVGMLTAVVVALVLRRTLLPGNTPPFVMELPSYKWPSLRTVLYRMVERGWAFVRRAATLIVAVAVVVWAALYYPHNRAEVEAPFAARRAALDQRLAELPADRREASPQWHERTALENEIAGAYQRQSWLGRAGRRIEPLVRPLGWDWRIGCAVIASFPAREVVVGTLGVIYNLGSELDPSSQQDRTRLQAALQSARWDGTDRPVYGVPVALSMMVFFALCAQCASTLVTIRRETNSWRWPLFTFTYMTALAYVGALATYQMASRWG